MLYWVVKLLETLLIHLLVLDQCIDQDTGWFSILGIGGISNTGINIQITLPKEPVDFVVAHSTIVDPQWKEFGLWNITGIQKRLNPIPFFEIGSDSTCCQLTSKTFFHNVNYLHAILLDFLRQKHNTTCILLQYVTLSRPWPRFQSYTKKKRKYYEGMWKI